MSTATPAKSPADDATFAVASHVRRQILERFPAGAPRGSWPAEEFAKARRDEGVPAQVVMDLPADVFLVVVRTGEMAVAA